MERRKIIIYSIFVVTVIYGIYFHFLSGEPTGKNPEPALSAGVVQASITAPDMNNNTDREIAVENTGFKKIENNTGRNPFQNPKFHSHKSSYSRPAVKYVKPVLTAISLDGDDTFVVVNNKIIKIGEYVGAWKLLKAEKGRALFESPSGSAWIKLGG